MGTGPSGRAVAVSGLIAITVVFALGAVAWDSAPKSTRAGSVRGSLLVASDRGILRRYRDGKLTQLTTDANDRFPAWSRDGTQIAFVRYPADRRELFCTSLSSTATEPASSRSAGQDRLLGSELGPGDRNSRSVRAAGGIGVSLWVVNVNGTGARRLLRGQGAIWKGRTQPGHPMAGRSSSAGQRAISTACLLSAGRQWPTSSGQAEAEPYGTVRTADVVARWEATRLRPRRPRYASDEDRHSDRPRRPSTHPGALAAEPWSDGRPELVAERLAHRLLRPLRPARLRLDDPEPRRDAAGSDARSLPARHLGPGSVAPRLSPLRGRPLARRPRVIDCTTSKSEPFTRPSVCSWSFDHRESGAPGDVPARAVVGDDHPVALERHEHDPSLARDSRSRSKLAFSRRRRPIGGRLASFEFARVVPSRKDVRATRALDREPERVVDHAAL